MRKKIKKVVSHPLISGSFIIFTGTLLANVCNFFFNLYMASNLSLANYGELASLISLMTIPGYATSAIGPLVVQFAGRYFSENNLALVANLYRRLGRFFFITGLILFVLFLIGIKYIGAFFQIHDTFLLVLTDFIIFLTLINIINTAILQAKLAFGYITAINIVGALLKLAIGIALVAFGFQTYGAMIGIFVSFLIPYFLSFIPIRFLFNTYTARGSVVKTKEIISYGVPSSVALIGLTSFISTDILLVKHFFDPKTAGLYAGLSLIGRVIYFLTAPITSVMFPLIVQKHTKKESYNSTFLLAIGLVIFPSLILTSFYFLFPSFVILTFIKRTEYLSIAPYVGIFAIYITIFSLLSILTNFFLSIKRTNVSYIIAFSSIVQAFLILLFHSSLVQVIYVSLSVAFLLLIALLLYYRHAAKEK